jgi:hypothetical protein
LAVAASLVAPRTAGADQVCVMVTVKDFVTGTHSVTPPCADVPLSLTYTEKYVQFPPWIEVTVGFTPPSDTP